MMATIEEDLYKIIDPVIQKSDISIELNGEYLINMDLIVTREKINLINNLKMFIRGNVSNPSMSLIFSKHFSNIFSKILFKSLDDIDQNVRIASDECINLIINLTSFAYSSYIIYNLFIVMRNHLSSRSLNGALQKFSNLSHLIKTTKRMSYINNLLPVLKVIMQNPEESVISTLVDTLPKIANILFPYASDTDIEKYMIVTLINSLKSIQVVSIQRNIANLMAISWSNLKSRKSYLEKILRYFVTSDFYETHESNENQIRGSLFVFKALIVSCTNSVSIDIDEFVFVLLRLIIIFDNPIWNTSIKNLSLECLLQLLHLYPSSPILAKFLNSVDHGNVNQLTKFNRDLIFKMDEEENEEKIYETSQDPSDLNYDSLGEIVEDSHFISAMITQNELSSDEIFDSSNNQSVEDMFILKDGYEETFVKSCSNQCDDLPFIDASAFSTCETDDESPSIFGAPYSLWTGSTIEYLVKMLIVEFLPEFIDLRDNYSGTREQKMKSQKLIRINSKVLAINCLAMICRMNYQVVLTPISILVDHNTYLVPSAIECVLNYCTHEDAQLSGSSIFLISQCLHSHFIQLKYFIKPEVLSCVKIDCGQLIKVIQFQINNPSSGQHLKSVLSAVKLFLSDLISSDYGHMAIDIYESVLRYTDHNYKLVRKEVLLIAQVADFRNLNIAAMERGSRIIKKTSLSDKIIKAILNLLTDIEQDIRDEACETLLSLINNGAFDREELFCDCFCHLYCEFSKNSLADNSSLIPFLKRDINVSLTDIRKKIHKKCAYHNAQSGIHRAVHLIIERLLSNTVSSNKDLKLNFSEINGFVHALLILHEKYPISMYSKVWIGQNIKEKVIETRTLFSYCLSLLNVSLITSDICLHTDLLCLISKLVFHGGIKHLLFNNLITERSIPHTGINTELNNNLLFVSSMKQFMVHLCRIMNIYWHIFQFITPSVPPHKTVLPNLSSQTHNSPAKKKPESGPPKGSIDSQSTTDSRPPRGKSSLGFFVNEYNYMQIHKMCSIAYNSYLISFDSSHPDRFLNLLTQCLQSLESIFEFFTFSEVSMHIEELLSYCTIFYNILPKPTVNLIIKLLGSLFGTNLTAQWDPFLSQLFNQLFTVDVNQENNSDLVVSMIDNWKKESIRNGCQLQKQLKNISSSCNGNDTLQIYKWKNALSDTFLWVKASGKRREPGILRQIAATNSNYRPSLGHYIGLFEKYVFQCMRQYLVSSAELQTSIIELLCQLIYLRVNYCQLDSEQKFLNIIQNQLENFTSYNIDDNKDAALIIKITDFLILISYEKAVGNRKDQPILNISQVVRCIESLLINEVNIRSVIITCLWKVVCDLFVHRTVWMNNPGNFNLLPNSNTTSDVEVQRETIVEFLLRKLIKYPETLEILALIVEHSAREQELKWQKVSNNIWSRLSCALFEDSIDFSTTKHIDFLNRLIQLLSLKAIVQPSFEKSIVDLALKVDDNPPKIQEMDLSLICHEYKLHVIQSVRSVICIQTIFIHNINYFDDFKSFYLLNDDEDLLNNEETIKQKFYFRIINIFKIMLKFYNFIINNSYLRESVNNEYFSMAKKLMKILLLIFIDIRILEHQNSSDYETNIIAVLDNSFNELPCFDMNLFLLWNEAKLVGNIRDNIKLEIPNQFQEISKDIIRNHVLQCSRHIVQINDSFLHDSIKLLVTYYYTAFIQLLNHKNVKKIVDIINLDEALSHLILNTFIEFSNEIIPQRTLLMKWLDMIENLHSSASIKIILLLSDTIIKNSVNFSVIILLKIETLIFYRLEVISKFEISTYLSIYEEIKSIKVSLNKCVVWMPNLKMKINFIERLLDKYIDQKPENGNICDPLIPEKLDTTEFNEQKFWRICVIKSLKNHDQDIRLGPRLLQGGSAAELEKIFGINLLTDEMQTQIKVRNIEIVSRLPPRFVQQCLRLGFLRSGGGMVQEGIRVDLIFKLGEKLLFEKLAYVLKESKIFFKNQTLNRLYPTVLIGLLAALNDYLILSCQLSVPMPITNNAIENLISFIEFLCLLTSRSYKFRSRILIEELLSLIILCYGGSSLLTEEGVKFMGNNLSVNQTPIIVSFLYMLVDQYSSNKLRGSIKYSLGIQNEFKSHVATLFLLDKILKYYYIGQTENTETEFLKKLRLAVISVARLPSLLIFTRNPKNIRDIDLNEWKINLENSSYKNIIEIDCLSKLNRDDIMSAQIILNTLGWTSRIMFEESWLLFLNLLHDKGPGFINLSSEEIVEQGHCDSLGLLGLTNLILQTTARPSPGNPVVAQLEHKTRDKTPNLLHTKTGRKLCINHVQLEEEIFHCHRGFRMLSAGWTISSWNLEREDSVLKYRHDQINIDVLSKRISIGSRSPQISGSSSNNLDVLSCLQSLPIICQQWFECLNNNDKQKSSALWPRSCALRSAVMLMDLFSSRDQIQWLLESLLALYKCNSIEDDWITTSWLCIGLSKCVAVLETSSNESLLPVSLSGKSPTVILTGSIYGLSQSLKLIDTCLNSDLFILQQSALHSAMCLLQMTVFGKNTWDLPPGSLAELKSIHEMVMSFLDNQLLVMYTNSFTIERSTSFSDSINIANSVNLNTNALSHVVSSGAASLANTVTGLTSIHSVNAQLSLISTGSSNSGNYFAPNVFPRLLKSNQGISLHSERHNYLIMSASCFYCEKYPDALPDSDILNNFVTLAKNVMQFDKKRESSPQLLLIMCRCLERISLTQRVSMIVTEQIIRLCSNFLKSCKSIIYSLPVMGLFLTSCYLSLASLNVNSTNLALYIEPQNFNGENQLVMLERLNLFWKRLTDTDTMDLVESRILSRLISNIMTDFMSSEELLNITIHQLLRNWPRSQFIAKTLFDVITKCLNKPEGEKFIRKWTLLVLQSLTCCRPDTLSLWASTVVLVASGSSVRSCLRALFSQCLDWLCNFEKGIYNISELEDTFCLAALAFLQDISRDHTMETDNKSTFFGAIQSNSNIPAFQKFCNIAREKHLL